MRNNKSARFHHTTPLRCSGHRMSEIVWRRSPLRFPWSSLRKVPRTLIAHKKKIRRLRARLHRLCVPWRASAPGQGAPRVSSLVNCDSGCVCASTRPSPCQLQMGSLGFQWCSAHVAREDHPRSWFAAIVALLALQHTDAPWHATGTVVP